MFLDIILLVISLALILLASILFTNGIELFGHRLNMHQGAIGSILAAVGTALPETIIPVIAILVYNDAQAKQVGIGAIAGAPFMLGTLAFFVTGAAVLVFAALGKRSRHMDMDRDVITRDLTFFIFIYGIAILTTFIRDWKVVKTIIAAGLCLSYLLYVRTTMRSECRQTEDVDRLYMARLLGVRESGIWIAVQVILSLAIMMFGAHVFVGCVTKVATVMGISAMVLSLFITPIATELPEKCNSVIWVRKRKDIMAFGNISGAMVFQSSFPVAFGVIFTEWDLHGAPMVSAILTLTSAFIILMWVKLKRPMNAYILMGGLLFYLAFVGYILHS